MKLTIVRHGQTDWNVDEKIQGQTDIVLNDCGKKQAEMVGKYLEGTDFDFIIASPLKRTMQTAMIINERLQLPLFCDDRLKERHFGSLEGVCKQAIAFSSYFDYQLNRSDGVKEAIIPFTKRVFAFLDEIKSIWPDKHILLVTHGAVSVPLYYYTHPDITRNDPLAHMIGNGETITYEVKM